ncbi:MAG: UTP--glucose-1-phosphate uridylyltransferase [Patescibacteria group bacterium]
MSKIRTAVIPVAGFGTRFLPASKAVPKELFPIGDRPLLQILVEEIVSAGIEKIVFVISAGKEAIQNHFSLSVALEKKLAEKGDQKLLAEVQKISRLAEFEFVEQREMHGDGHAILQAREKISDENFLVVFGDELILGEPTRQLVAAFESKNSAIVGLQKVPRDEVSHFGIVALDENSAIQKFVEKPSIENAPSDLAIVGKYIVPQKIFDILATHPNSSGEIRLIDALALLQKSEPIFGEILAGQRFDCGQKAGWLAANFFLARQDPEIAKIFEAN